MAVKRVPLKVNPSPSADTASIEVEWEVDGNKQAPPSPLGPEGNPRLILGTIDLADNASITVTGRVIAVDGSGNKQPAPSEFSRTYTGKDTTGPEPSPSPELLDLEDEA